MEYDDYLLKTQITRAKLDNMLKTVEFRYFL